MPYIWDFMVVWLYPAISTEREVILGYIEGPTTAHPYWKLPIIHDDLTTYCEIIDIWHCMFNGVESTITAAEHFFESCNRQYHQRSIPKMVYGLEIEILFALVMKIMRLVHEFAHITGTLLSSHEQNCEVIWLFFTSENIVFASLKFRNG